MTYDPHPFTAATSKLAYAQAFSRSNREPQQIASPARGIVAALLRRRTR